MALNNPKRIYRKNGTLTEVLLCKIRNVLAEELLCDETLSLEKRMETVRPVHSIRQSYFRWNGTEFGSWGEPMQKVLNDLKGR